MLSWPLPFIAASWTQVECQDMLFLPSAFQLSSIHAATFDGGAAVSQLIAPPTALLAPVLPVPPTLLPPAPPLTVLPLAVLPPEALPPEALAPVTLPSE